MKTLFLSASKKFFYFFAGLIILFALLVSLGRVLAPILDQYRPEIEKVASGLLKAPVTIEKARVTWYKYEPVITLYNVTAHNEKNNAPILQVKKVRILLSIFQSIWQRKPILGGVLVSGTDITLVRSDSGDISIQGFPELGASQTPYQSKTKLLDIIAWVSTQPSIILEDIDIHYLGLAGQKRYITLYKFHIDNSGGNHHVHGTAILHQSLPTEVTVSGDWTGVEVDPAKIKAKLYVYVSGFSLSQWLKGVSYQDWQLDNGVGSAKIWMTFDQGLTQLQSQFQIYDLSVTSLTNHITHQFQRLSGDVGWRRDGQNQIIAGDDILIDRADALWPVTSFYVLMVPNANHALQPKTINIGYINLGDIQNFFKSVPSLIPPSITNQLASLKLAGNLQNIKIALADNLGDWQKTSVESDFNRLTFQSVKDYPGVQNLQGKVKWDGAVGSLVLESQQSTITLNHIFQKPLVFDALTGNIAITQDAVKNWQIKLNDVQVMNHDLSVNASGSFTRNDKGAVNSDLNANFTVVHAEGVPNYLPMGIFDKDLVQWLNSAFLSGQVTAGKALLRGPIMDFPFDKNNGVFQITGTVNNIDLRFAPDWPIVKGIYGNLFFENRKMQIDLTQASTQGIDVKNISAEIPYLGDAAPAVLYVQIGDVDIRAKDKTAASTNKTPLINTDFAKGMSYIHASPLEKSIGRVFDQLDMTGNVQVALGLKVPLNHPDDTEAVGYLTFDNAKMNMPKWKLNIDNLSGKVNFTDKSTDAKNVRGVLFSKPIQFNLATIKSKKNISYIEVSCKNNFSVSDIESWLNIPFSPIVKGATDISALVDLSFDAPVEIHLKSDLVGIALDLPKPYDKDSSLARSFSADITIDNDKPLRAKLNYSNLLSAALILNSTNNQFNLTSANLHLGGGDVSWPPTEGLYISGSVPELNWDKIKSYADQAASTKADANNKFASLALRGIDISTPILNLFGQNISQVRLQITPDQNNWNINVTSSAVSGSIQFPKVMSSNKIIDAQFKRLNLSSDGQGNQTATFSLANMPSILFSADNFIYNGMALGAINFKASPMTNGMSIENFSITSSSIDMRSSGTWIQKGKQNTTELQGEANSKNVSDLLSSLGINAHNFIASKGKLKFNLSWPAPPFAPTARGLNGRAYIELGEGRIVDVGQASGAKMDLGKMLSIFSLQTIPRRLSLNFSDLFQKGYSFDSFKGNFKLSDGDAYTTDTRFDGPVAKIGITGRIGFSDKDVDLTLSVTPYVTSSIPIAATLISGPVIGLAALAVNTVVSSAVSKATTYYYAVQGSWANPTWGEIKGN